MHRWAQRSRRLKQSGRTHRQQRHRSALAVRVTPRASAAIALHALPLARAVKRQVVVSLRKLRRPAHNKLGAHPWPGPERDDQERKEGETRPHPSTLPRLDIAIHAALGRHATCDEPTSCRRRSLRKPHPQHRRVGLTAAVLPPAPGVSGGKYAAPFSFIRSRRCPRTESADRRWP